MNSQFHRTFYSREYEIPSPQIYSNSSHFHSEASFDHEFLGAKLLGSTLNSLVKLYEESVRAAAFTAMKNKVNSHNELKRRVGLLMRNLLKDVKHRTQRCFAQWSDALESAHDFNEYQRLKAITLYETLGVVANSHLKMSFGKLRTARRDPQCSDIKTGLRTVIWACKRVLGATLVHWKTSQAPSGLQKTLYSEFWSPKEQVCILSESSQQQHALVFLVQVVRHQALSRMHSGFYRVLWFDRRHPKLLRPISNYKYKQIQSAVSGLYRVLCAQYHPQLSSALRRL